MAWEWVAPTASGLVAVGVAIAGAVTSIRIARSNHEGAIRLAREQRRAEAYQQIVEVIVGQTAELQVAMDMFRFSPPMARLDIDPVETKRVIALSIAHGTPEVRRSVEDFQSALLDIAFGHGLISAPSTLEGYYTALEGRTMQDVIEAKRRVEDCVHSELIG